MREQLIALYRLQEIDSRVLEIEKMAEVIPNKVSELESGLEAIRSELGALRAEDEAQKAESTEAEAQIREEGGKTTKWKRRLNEIKTPREYQALSREVEQGERLVRGLEERVMEHMTEIESRAAVIAEKEAEFKEAEASTGGRIRELREQQQKFATEARAARTGRDEITAQLPPKLLKKYERVATRRQGLAVAVTRNSACTGCNVEVRPQMMVELRRLNAIIPCSQCARILIPEGLVSGESEE